MNNPVIFTFDSEKDFLLAAKEDVLLSIVETLSDYEECRIGLAGGSTPKKLYESLANEDIPWQKTKIIQIDERYVPSDHSQSNLKMLRQTLLTKIPIPPENIIAFETALPADSAIKEMDRKIAALKQARSPIFDLLILGAGADGHIASLFEGDDALRSENLASLANAQNQEIQKRLTLTVPALKSASRALLLLKGQTKLPITQALNGQSEMPRLTALRELILEMPTKVLFAK